MEILFLLGIFLGGLLALIGWIWLIVLGFKEGGALWGVLIIFFSWIAGIVFCFTKKTGWIPLALMLVGIVIYVIGVVPMMLKYSGMEGLPS